MALSSNQLTAKLALENAFASLTANNLTVSDITHLLQESGVNPNFKLPDGQSLLWKAVQNGNLVVAQVLIEKGADINEEIQNETLLSTLCAQLEASSDQTVSANVAAVKFLIRSGANPFWQLKKGGTLDLFAKAMRNKAFFQAIRENNVERKKVDEENQRMMFHRLVKRVGHLIGSKKKIQDIETEGNHAFLSYALLETYLEQMSRENFSIEFKQYYQPLQSPIREAFNLARNWLEIDEETNHKSIMEHYHSGKPTILPVTWSEAKNSPVNMHTISVIVWNDILILTNRGAEKLHYGNINVFKIDNPQGRMTEEFLKFVLPDNGIPLSTDVLLSIQILVGWKPPLLTLIAKNQKYGNCSFANCKTAMQALLLFLSFLTAEAKQTKDLDSAFLESFLKTSLEECKIKTNSKAGVIMRSVLLEYKTFTHYMRFKFTKDLCEDFKKLPKNSPIQKSYLEVFEAMLEEHYYAYRNDKPVKNQVEISRAKMIMDTITSALPASKDLWPLQCQIVASELRDLEVLQLEFQNRFDEKIEAFCTRFTKMFTRLPDPQANIMWFESQLERYCAQYYVDGYSIERREAELARAKKIINTIQRALPSCQMEWPPQLRRQAILLAEAEKGPRQATEVEGQLKAKQEQEERDNALAAELAAQFEAEEREQTRQFQEAERLKAVRQAAEVEAKLKAEQEQVVQVQPPVVPMVIRGRNGKVPPPPPPRPEIQRGAALGNSF